MYCITPITTNVSLLIDCSWDRFGSILQNCFIIVLHFFILWMKIINHFRRSASRRLTPFTTKLFIHAINIVEVIIIYILNSQMRGKEFVNILNLVNKEINFLCKRGDWWIQWINVKCEDLVECSKHSFFNSDSNYIWKYKLCDI